jgi:hypothetical protein
MRRLNPLLAILFFCALSPLAVSAQKFAPPVAYSTGSLAPNGVALGDLNGDGNLDVVVANTDSSIRKRQWYSAARGYLSGRFVS